MKYKIEIAPKTPVLFLPENVEGFNLHGIIRN